MSALAISRHAPAAGWAALVAALLLFPTDGGGDPRWPWLALLEPWLDKFVHFVLFAILAWLLGRSFGAIGGLRRPLLTAVSVAAVYGFLLEGLQHFVPGRGADPMDALADLAGASLALLPLVSSALGRRARHG